MSAVSGLVGWIGIAIQEISAPWQARRIGEVPAGYVVDVAIAVVIPPCLPPLLYVVHPHLLNDIRVSEVEPRVDDGNQHGSAPDSSRLFPAHGGEVPLLGELGIVGNRSEAPEIIRLGLSHRLECGVLRGHIEGIGCGTEGQPRPPTDRGPAYVKCADGSGAPVGDRSLA